MKCLTVSILSLLLFFLNLNSKNSSQPVKVVTDSFNVQADFAHVSLLGRHDLDYTYIRRLLPETLTQMKVISANIIEKVHLIKKYE